MAYDYARRSQGFVVRFALSVVWLALAGCPGDGNSPRDDGGFGCPAAMKECVDNQLARVCPEDGSGWISKPCTVGSMCQGGECVTTSPVCNPGEGVCASETSGFVCNAEGTGYQTVTCPSGTNCAGPGLCQGACVVGSSYCADFQTVASCTDGRTYQSTTCSGTDRCVRTDHGPLERAACKPAECAPDTGGCDQVCGNRTVAVTDQDPTWLSFCAETPLGYKWTAQKCATGTSCSPGGRVCGPSDARTEAACVGACTIGETRCSADRSAIETCGVDGNWSSALTKCAASTYCATTPRGPKKAVCAEPLCAFAWSTGLTLGACSGDDKIRLCGDDGKLGAESSCPTGRCQASAVMPQVGTTVIGVCTVECLPGDGVCLDGGLRRLCENGLWSTPVQCTEASSGNAIAECTQLTAPISGRPRALCGEAECAPGSASCSKSGSGPATLIQYCNDDGKYGIPVECLGYCDASAPQLAQCVAECIPGAAVCVGDTVDLASSPIVGRSHATVCGSNGRLPTENTWTKCLGDTACRTSLAGVSLGCVACVGSANNELGLIDSRCDGDDAVQTCGADNTWGSSAACGGTKVCVPPSDGAPSDAQLYCHACDDSGWPGSVPCTDAARRALVGDGCAATVTCPKSAIDSTLVIDCCASSCTALASAAATPAYCVEIP